MFNIVTNQKVVDEIKKCKYFKMNLGMVATVEKSGERVYNEKDKFSHFYNTQYKTTIYMKGNVGDIVFYLDHYIKEDVLAVYYNTEEFIFNFDQKMITEKGVEFYLGHIIKTLETEHEERLKAAEEKKIETKKPANPGAVINNPGAVSFDDLKAYLQEKNKNKYTT